MIWSTRFVVAVTALTFLFLVGTAAKMVSELSHG